MNFCPLPETTETAKNVKTDKKKVEAYTVKSKDYCLFMASPWKQISDKNRGVIMNTDQTGPIVA